MMPATGEGTSFCVLSVSRRYSGWPTATCSPSATSHSTIEPSPMDMPSLGIFSRDAIAGSLLLTVIQADRDSGPGDPLVQQFVEVPDLGLLVPGERQHRLARGLHPLLHLRHVVQ